MSIRKVPRFAAVALLEELRRNDAWRWYCPVAFTRFEANEKRLQCAICAANMKMYACNAVGYMRDNGVVFRSTVKTLADLCSVCRLGSLNEVS